MAEKVALVTGADRGLGYGLAAGLLERGWFVLAGQYMPAWPDLGRLGARYPGRLAPILLDVSLTDSVRSAAERVETVVDHIDLLVNNAGVISPNHGQEIDSEQDYAGMVREYQVNALGPLRMVESFLPLLLRGQPRRLCFVSSEAGSIAGSTRTAWFGYCMSKAALNMGVRNLFNGLRPKGFTFRLYHPGWVRSYMGGEKNLEATLEPEEAAGYALDYFLAGMAGGGPAVDEERLVLRDHQGKEYPW
jgi:NAD(P)-dependent dehydrogenase (short-subunit alcohol dehydrogenase family)